MTGSSHSLSEANLQRNLDEIAFRWNTHSSLANENTELAAPIVRRIIGKRLKYQKPREEHTVATVDGTNGDALDQTPTVDRSA